MLVGSPTEGDNIKSGYITPAFSEAQKWVDWLHNPAFLGVPIEGDKIRSGYLTPEFLGADCLVRGSNGPYRLIECPSHRQFQPLVQRFLHSDRVPFLVGVLHYRMYICSMRRLLAGMYPPPPCISYAKVPN